MSNPEQSSHPIREAIEAILSVPLGRISLGPTLAQLMPPQMELSTASDFQYQVSPRDDPVYVLGIDRIVLRPLPPNGRRRQGKSY